MWHFVGPFQPRSPLPTWFVVVYFDLDYFCTDRLRKKSARYSKGTRKNAWSLPPHVPRTGRREHSPNDFHAHIARARRDHPPPRSTALHAPLAPASQAVPQPLSPPSPQSPRHRRRPCTAEGTQGHSAVRLEQMRSSPAFLTAHARTFAQHVGSNAATRTREQRDGPATEKMAERPTKVFKRFLNDSHRPISRMHAQKP